MATAENFHLSTKATFEPVKYGSQAAKLFTELVAENGLFFKSESGSQYVLKDGVVYRMSDHWGHVASCVWFLKYNPIPRWERTKVIVAKCDLVDFEKIVLS